MKYFIGAITLLYCAAVSCKKVPSIQPSEDTYFIIKQDGNTLPDSILSQIELFYYTSSGQYVDNPGYDDTSFVYLAKSYFPARPEFHNTKIMFFRYLTDRNLNQDVYDFYLKYPNGDIDTLWVKGKLLTNEEAVNHPCRCSHPLSELRFNGEAVKDTTISRIGNQPVYLFEK